MQQANDATAEQIFLVAVHNAEAFGLEDRRVAVSLSQLAQVYAGQGKYAEADPVYLRALGFIKPCMTNFTPMSLPRSTTWRSSIACTACMPRRSPC